MLSKVKIKAKAIALRRKGLSYKEIMEIISVSKSTLSNWISQIELTTEERELLQKNMLKGRDRSRYASIIANKDKRLARQSKVEIEAGEEFEEYYPDNLFFIGITLYWAEGGKKSKYFQFMNSDPEMICLMIKWIEKFLKIPRNELKYSLYIHEPYADERCEEFWATKIGVSRLIFNKTIYKSTPHNTKKNPEYKGCFRINWTRIDTFYKVMTWQKLLIRYYKGLMRP